MAVLHLKSHIFPAQNFYQLLNQHLKRALLMSFRFIFTSMGLPILCFILMKQGTKFIRTIFFLALLESLGIEKILPTKKLKEPKRIYQSSIMFQIQWLQLE